VIDETHIKEIECELRSLRLQLANCESQNRILVAYVLDVQKRRRRRLRSLDAKRHRQRYVAFTRPIAAPLHRHIKLMAPAVRERLSVRLQQTL